MPSRHLRRCLYLPVAALLLASLIGCNHSPAPALVLPVEAEPITPANVAQWCQCDTVLNAVDLSADFREWTHQPKAWATGYTLPGGNVPQLIIAIAPPNEFFKVYQLMLLIAPELGRDRQIDQTLSYSGFEGGMSNRGVLWGLPCAFALGYSDQNEKQILIIIPAQLDNSETSLLGLSPLDTYGILESVFAHVAIQTATEAP
jgi:hypothetical protein